MRKNTEVFPERSTGMLRNTMPDSSPLPATTTGWPLGRVSMWMFTLGRKGSGAMRGGGGVSKRWREDEEKREGRGRGGSGRNAAAAKKFCRLPFLKVVLYTRLCWMLPPARLPFSL